jgi:hypothetical protein
VIKYSHVGQVIGLATYMDQVGGLPCYPFSSLLSFIFYLLSFIFYLLSFFLLFCIFLSFFLLFCIFLSFILYLFIFFSFYLLSFRQKKAIVNMSGARSLKAESWKEGLALGYGRRPCKNPNPPRPGLPYTWKKGAYVRAWKLKRKPCLSINHIIARRAL